MLAVSTTAALATAGHCLQLGTEHELHRHKVWSDRPVRDSHRCMASKGTTHTICSLLLQNGGQYGDRMIFTTMDSGQHRLFTARDIRAKIHICNPSAQRRNR